VGVEVDEVEVGGLLVAGTARTEMVSARRVRIVDVNFILVVVVGVRVIENKEMLC
jgi:hypothetical protein